jgi:hypothetical protein
MQADNSQPARVRQPIAIRYWPGLILGRVGVRPYHRESMQKGLRLMAMCTGIFAPSVEFLPYLEQFLDELSASNSTNEIGMSPLVVIAVTNDGQHT